MSDIKNVKTIGGEDVIGRLVKQDPHVVILKKPLVLQWSQAPNGDVVPNLVPFAPLAAGDIIPLERSAIMFVTDANEEIEKDYLRATTGLTIPTKPGLILE